MTNNKDIIKSIVTISDELGKEAPDTKGKNKNQLNNILSVLKAELIEETDVVEEKLRFIVAEGKSITTRRGILSEGNEIKADDMSGGKQALKAFVKSGHVIKS